MVYAWYEFGGWKFEICMQVAAEVAECETVIGVCDDLMLKKS